MLEQVNLKPVLLESYREVVGDEIVDAIRARARPLAGKRVLHVNATAYGGGVAEILATVVPLMNDVGLEAEWRVIAGDLRFFSVTKAMHNGLQGMELPFTEPMQAAWRENNHLNAEALEGEYDFVIVHDPQPAGIPAERGRAGGAHWIWRCHIDTSRPNPAYWEFLAPSLEPYDALIFTMPAYVGPGIPPERVVISPPTIDPLSPKNLVTDRDAAREALRPFGLDPARPILTQVSRFDPWKDPLGVIDAYRLVKAEIPEVQLALPGSMASDDPEGWSYLDRTCRYAGMDDDIHILHNFQGVGPVEIGAFQAGSDVVIQKSTREGFGLVVSEALWKGTPVVGGNVGGIPLQVIDGETGYLVADAEGCARRCLDLLRQPEMARRMGQAGREHVRRNFLTTRKLMGYLNLLERLAGGKPLNQAPG